MEIVVGKTSQPTPMMAGLIRYAIFNPYWNVPEDLARDTYARRVLKEGPGYLATARLEALSDWTGQAKVLDPTTVDWTAVAEGRRSLRLRQRPGAGNMMGQVKLMLPNELGIYLHDTPFKALFAQSPRTFSSGCVRLEDAARLTRWLLGTRGAPGADPRPERQVDLPRPAPVYITYFTVAPGPDGPIFRKDPYRRDAVQIARLQGRVILR